MKLKAEYSFDDFRDLFYNCYYFNSKQNKASRILIKLTLSVFVFEMLLFIFSNELFHLINSYIDAKFMAFLALLLIGFYFFKPKIFYETYKKAQKPGNYIELDEKEFKLYFSKEVKIEMKRLKNTVALKHGYFLDFDDTFLVYIPHRFFRSSEDLRFFHSLCLRSKN